MIAMMIVAPFSKALNVFQSRVSATVWSLSCIYIKRVREIAPTMHPTKFTGARTTNTSDKSPITIEPIIPPVEAKEVISLVSSSV